MDFIRTLLAESPIVYVARDIERALGMKPSENYRIITNDSDYAREVKAQYPEYVLTVKGTTHLDTEELIERPEALSFIKQSAKKSSLLVFKNTKRIERIAKEHSLALLNPDAEPAQKVEDKLSQIDWLDELACHLPPHTVTKIKDIEWSEEAFILQFNHAHTGEGTILVKDLPTLNNLKRLYPDRPVKKAAYIQGPTFTLNAISSSTAATDIEVAGNISYQITGIAPFTEKPFATIGNDWGYAEKSLNTEQRRTMLNLASKISQKLHRDGWRGLFGIDYIVSEKTGQVYLLEINARQAASTSYESQLQDSTQSEQITIFEAHLISLLSRPPHKIARITDGAQIIQRRTSSIHSINEKQKSSLREVGLNLITYEEGKENSDLVRIQSKESLIKKHKTLNETSLKISSILNQYQGGDSAVYQYTHISLGSSTVICPYFNNKKRETRAGLRALIGKGTAQEIVEEAELLAVREKINLKELTPQEIRKFLIEHQLGIDCSGFAFHVLNAVSQEITGRKIQSNLSWSHKKSLTRKIISHFRPAENCDVRTLAHNSNSSAIPLSAAKKWDIITSLTERNSGNIDHIFIITDSKHTQESTILSFAHAIAWPKDGNDQHGIHTGKVVLRPNTNHLADAEWFDDSLSAEEYKKHLNNIRSGLELRRLNWLAK